VPDPAPPPPRVRTWPDPVLRVPAGPPPPPGPELHRLLDTVWRACRVHGGAGLAAPQVGVPVRVAVVDAAAVDGGRGPIELVDPRIVRTWGRQRRPEGCLSLPGLEAAVTRPRRVEVHARDRHGRPVVVRGEGLLARVLCHELDHLDGVLLLDRLPRWRRRLARWRLRRALAAAAAHSPRGRPALGSSV